MFISDSDKEPLKVTTATNFEGTYKKHIKNADTCVGRFLQILTKKISNEFYTFTMLIFGLLGLGAVSIVNFLGKLNCDNFFNYYRLNTKSKPN